MARKNEIDTTSEGSRPDEPDAAVTYWLNEISAAKKREKDYRKEGRRILEIYEGEKPNETPFNILYSNTETLLPALYSAVPRPVVQRRFKDDDPLGKAAATAGQRVLEFLVDTNVEGYETFDEGMKAATLDGLLPGRAVTCIKYDAEIGEFGTEQTEGTEIEATPYKKSELVCIETRGWDRVYFGYAKKWSKVPWVAYEEHIDREEAARLFGKDVSNKLTYTDEEDDEDGRKTSEEKNRGERKTACIYKIWDKDGEKKVRFISAQYKEGYLRVDDDPLQLTGFFDCPRPLHFLEKSNNLKPVSLYKLYENQADELNRLTIRIQRIVSAIKAKGIYDAELGDDIKDLIEADDNTLVPADKSSSLAAEKGLQNAIWFWPTEQLVNVLTQLLVAREQCKQVIYEIMGISDIVRGASKASETFGAQELKSKYGTLRLSRLQKEVQRYARDILRMMLEIAATKFSEETWAKMTGLPFLLEAKYNELTAVAQALQQQIAVESQMAQRTQPQAMPPQASPQAQPQPSPSVMQLQQVAQQLQAPRWSKVLEMLRDDTQRSYRIDIETNSTVEPEAVEDQKQISEVMTALGQFLNGVGPLVVNGVMPFQAAQSMMLAIVRRYRFGIEIEDYVKAMQAPKPPDDGKAAEAAKVAAEQQQHSAEMQRKDVELKQQQMVEEGKHAREQQAEQNRAAEESARIQAQRELDTSNIAAETQREMMKIAAEKDARISELQAERHTEQMKAAMVQDTELKKAALQGAVTIQVAEINAAQKAQAVEGEQKQAKEGADKADAMMAKILETQNKLLAQIGAPKDAIRGKDGKIVSIVPRTA